MHIDEYFLYIYIVTEFFIRIDAKFAKWPENANAIRSRDREEISTPLEANESKSEATSTAGSSNREQSKLLFLRQSFFFLSLTRGHVKTRQHVNQFKLLQKYDVQLDQ